MTARRNPWPLGLALGVGAFLALLVATVTFGILHHSDPVAPRHLTRMRDPAATWRLAGADLRDDRLRVRLDAGPGTPLRDAAVILVPAGTGGEGRAIPLVESSPGVYAGRVPRTAAGFRAELRVRRGESARRFPLFVSP